MESDSETSCRAEINPQPRESRSGQKLVIANQWVRSCNMIEKRVDLVYLKDQMGHSSIKVTVDVYGSMVKRDDKPVDILDDILHPIAPYTHPETKQALNDMR